MLHLFNKCWKKKKAPSIWKKAIVIPILKPGKDANSPASYRPISLTSCVAKLMERLVGNRLQYWLESNNKLSPFQAGFRQNRGTEDQIAYMVQSITDGFQQKPPKRTVLTTIDYARAFDTIWKDALYFKMAKMNIPRCVIDWIRDFLSDRYACVEIGDVRSKYRLMRNGLPQGAVLSPMLFCIYINDLPETALSENVSVSLYADDLAVWSSSSVISEAENAVQEALTSIACWAKDWNMKINVSKCETCLFTTSTREAKHRIDLVMNENHVPFNTTPKFLGITLDRSLSMSAHISNIKDRMTKRLRPLLALTGTSWGCRKEELRQLYIQYIRSVAEYVMPTWYSAASKTQSGKIETLQNAAARIISGCVKSTPINELLAEAKLPPIKNRARELTAINAEKALRLNPDNPRAKAYQVTQHQRLKTQDSWREKGKEELDKMQLSNINREKLQSFSAFPPWSSLLDIDIKLNLNEPVKNTDSDEHKQQITSQTLASLPEAQLELWTDGSAESGMSNGGAGILMMNNITGDRQQISKPAGALVNSTVAELIAIDHALSAAKTAQINDAQIKEIRICLDSKAALQSIQKGSTNNDTITSILEKAQDLQTKGCHITFQWIPSHCGIVENEISDVLAKKGCDLDQSIISVTFAAAKATIKAKVKQDEEKLRNNDLWEKEDNVSKSGRRSLAQLRAHGHCPLLGAYRHRIGLQESPNCELCGVPDNVIHLLDDCLKHEPYRRRQTDPEPLSIQLFTNPKEVAMFLARAGLIC